MNDLPDSLTPADCDLRDSAVPLDMLIQLAMTQFGLSAADAEAAARECAARAGIALAGIAHG